MDSTTRANRAAWEAASHKHVREYAELLARARAGFPAHGAVEWQWTLGRIVTALTDAGLRIRHLGEHPEPFWRMGGVDPAAWDGRLPNTFSLLAGRP